MEEPTGPDPRLDGPVDQIEAQTARYHAVSASMSSTAHADMAFAGEEYDDDLAMARSG